MTAAATHLCECGCRQPRTPVVDIQPPPWPRSGLAKWEACCAGREPAESLHARDREDLVVALVERGWTDLDIAVLTRMSLYTTERIRQRTGLRPNRSTGPDTRLGWTAGLDTQGGAA